MSITAEIRKRVSGHLGCTLFELSPSIDGESIVREMIVSKDVLRAVSPPWPANRDSERHVSFRASMDAFLDNEWMSVSENPFSKPWDSHVARVHPVADEIWDIRCFDVPPGIRCLGAFGGYNLFIALTWNYRELIESTELWEKEIENCKAEWDKFFSPIPRFKGETLNEYLSNYLAV
jgi:hypothetical protein